VSWERNLDTFIYICFSFLSPMKLNDHFRTNEVEVQVVFISSHQAKAGYFNFVCSESDDAVFVCERNGKQYQVCSLSTRPHDGDSAAFL
jgi:hypothetical protein